jgi:hypothetical protein
MAAAGRVARLVFEVVARGVLIASSGLGMMVVVDSADRVGWVRVLALAWPTVLVVGVAAWAFSEWQRLPSGASQLERRLAAAEKGRAAPVLRPVQGQDLEQ